MRVISAPLGPHVFAQRQQQQYKLALLTLGVSNGSEKEAIVLPSSKAVCFSSPLRRMRARKKR